MLKKNRLGLLVNKGKRIVIYSYNDNDCHDAHDVDLKSRHLHRLYILPLKENAEDGTDWVIFGKKRVMRDESREMRDERRYDERRNDASRDAEA